MKRQILLLLVLPLLFLSCNDFSGTSSSDTFINSSETSAVETETSRDESDTSASETDGSSTSSDSSRDETDADVEQSAADADKTDSSSEQTASSSEQSDTSAEKTDSPSTSSDNPADKTASSSEQTDNPTNQSENPQNQDKNSAQIEKLPNGIFRIFAPNVSQNKFYDANKTSGDEHLCWAASSANLIAWYQDLYEKTFSDAKDYKTLDSALPRSEQEIFSKFKSTWANQEGSFANGILWYIAGTVSHTIDGGFLLNYLNSSKWRPFNPTAYKQVENISSLKDFSNELILALENAALACGITDRNFKKGVSGHAITIWGAEFSQDFQNPQEKIVNSIWISDSDDSKTALVKCTLSQERDSSTGIDFVKIDYKVYPAFDKIKNIMILYKP